MKILKISATGLPLFKEKCEIDFVAMQRVSGDNAEKMSVLFSSNTQTFYQNNVMSFIGINASGKTSILKLITFVGRMLRNEAINNILNKDVLDGLDENGQVCFDVYFYSPNGTVNWLHTIISKNQDGYVITDECLKSKASAKVTSKLDIFNFDKYDVIMQRNQDEAYLLDDVSIIVAFNKQLNDRLIMNDTLHQTNHNRLQLSENCPIELIAFFDPSIEYLRFVNDSVSKQFEATLEIRNSREIRLKFYNQEEMVLHHPVELNRYLSSGTIKGIGIFLRAMRAFRHGGYLVVDEIENHFNREIVSTLMRFFMDPKVNPKGAMLLFSTHYAELLDEFERNDNVYIVRNRDGITAENLSVVLKRNDLKKSEAYQSGYLEGTVPAYEAYMTLKKSLINPPKEVE